MPCDQCHHRSRCRIIRASEGMRRMDGELTGDFSLFALSGLTRRVGPGRWETGGASDGMGKAVRPSRPCRIHQHASGSERDTSRGNHGAGMKEECESFRKEE